MKKTKETNSEGEIGQKETGARMQTYAGRAEGHSSDGIERAIIFICKTIRDS